MTENTTVDRSDGERRSLLAAIHDGWRRFVLWLADVNMWYILGGGFALGLLADHAGYHSVDWLFFLGGGLLPIVLATVPDEEDDYEVSNWTRLKFVVSMLLWSVTPWGILTQVLQIGGNFVPYFRYRGRLPNRERHVPETDLSAPFDGEWDVGNGGVTEDTSHSWGLVSQRYAYDFVVTEDDSTHAGDGDDNEDYYAFGEPIRAPADGTVVGTGDSLRDYPRPGTGTTEWRTWRIFGNYVIVEHADGEYSLLAHLKEGSVTVEPGDEVSRGDVLGRCGNSGNSSEPHLHYQLMDRPNVWTAAGLVPEFVDVDISRDESRYADSDVYHDPDQCEEWSDSEGTDRKGVYLVAGDEVGPASTEARTTPPPTSRS